MTDHHKVLVFGSFTDHEIKSLQTQPTENDVEITFGSLDSATLRSVGIFNTKPIELECSKPVNGNNAVNSPKEIKSPILSVPCLSGNVCDPPNQCSPKQNATEDVNISSEPLATEASVNSSEILDLVDSKENTLTASNEPSVAVRNLLPRGLVNSGNLCFLNATLQALISCSPFVQLLQELRTCNIPEIEYPTLCAFVEFISDFDMLLDSSSKKCEAVLETGRPLHPVMFESVLKNFSPDVSDSLSGRPRQEDAQEFLSFVMHQMHEELLKIDSQFPNGNGGKASLVSSTNDEDDDDNWETVGPKNKTAITRTQSFIPSKLSVIFGGQLRSVVKARGNKASATIQPFLLLHLNICPEQVCTIEDALRMFSAPETLEGYRASAAGKAEVVSASKSVKISELPEIMILHLVRFSYGSQGSTKLHKPVRFPLELVLGRELLVSPSSKGRRYELVATITHHGRDPSRGHYTADSRHCSSSKWMRYDDAFVAPIPTSKVLHDQAYVLFYRRL
ncbi:hypothetical protein LguiB_001401 [Lonicera macranthoides]